MNIYLLQLSNPMSPTGQHASQRHSQSPPVGGMPLMTPVDRLSKLRSELGTVQQNCFVFGDLLTEIANGDVGTSDLELLEVWGRLYSDLLLLSLFIIITWLLTSHMSIAVKRGIILCVNDRCCVCGIVYIEPPVYTQSTIRAIGVRRQCIMS